MAITTRPRPFTCTPRPARSDREPGTHSGRGADHAGGQGTLRQAPGSGAKSGDANDTLYELELIYDYSPEADLPKIKAHVMLINNVEDFADPPTLGTVERAFKKIAHGTYVLTPYGEDTHGHFTHYYAAVWKPYLVKFMSGLPPVLKDAQ